jgi:hypothetical protein
MPRGQRKVLIELVDPGNVFTGQTVAFNSPGRQGRARGLHLAPHTIQEPRRHVTPQSSTNGSSLILS